MPRVTKNASIFLSTIEIDIFPAYLQEKKRKEKQSKNTYVKEKYVYLCLCFYFVFYLDQECGKLILQQKKKHTGALEAL